MNRNILFKAKTLIGRELRIGSLIQSGDSAVIVNLGGNSIDAIEVDPDTVQQMTNCYHHGRYVWEGDVFADPAKPDERYTVHYDIIRDEFRIALPDEGHKTRLSMPLVYYLAEHPELEYMGNIIDLTDNTDKP